MAQGLHNEAQYSGTASKQDMAPLGRVLRHRDRSQGRKHGGESSARRPQDRRYPRRVEAGAEDRSPTPRRRCCTARNLQRLRMTSDRRRLSPRDELVQRTQVWVQGRWQFPPMPFVDAPGEVCRVPLQLGECLLVVPRPAKQT